MDIGPQVRELFGRLLDLDREQRSTYLREHPTDTAILSAVESLLANDSATDADLRGLVEHPARALLAERSGTSSLPRSQEGTG